MESRTGHEACTVWLTGLSGAGKSTLGLLLAAHLSELSLPRVLLDGDDIRTDLCRDLGYSKADRDENVRRIGSVARLLNDNGVFCIAAAISPHQAARDEVRAKVRRFLEVHVDCSIETLIRRDTKGLYRRALNHEFSNFTGISDPYDRPVQPEVRVDSGEQSEEACFLAIVSALEDRNWVPRDMRTTMESKVANASAD